MRLSHVGAHREFQLDGVHTLRWPAVMSRRVAALEASVGDLRERALGADRSRDSSAERMIATHSRIRADVDMRQLAIEQARDL